MTKDLARIKDKEKALDAENKILRSQLFSKQAKKKANTLTVDSPARDRAMDYH